MKHLSPQNEPLPPHRSPRVARRRTGEWSPVSSIENLVRRPDDLSTVISDFRTKSSSRSSTAYSSESSYPATTPSPVWLNRKPSCAWCRLPHSAASLGSYRARPPLRWKEASILALWDSPCQREAYAWFIAELANLRTAFRWATDHGYLDHAATIATYAALIGFWVENYEPVAWAEELIQPARVVDHPRLVFLYTMAAQCWIVGRIEEAVHYCDAGQTVMRTSRGAVPFGLDGALANPYMALGQADRCDEALKTRSRNHRQR